MEFSSQRPAPAVSRVRRGRWLAGVCAGIAAFRGYPVGLVRVVFLLGAVVGGLGGAMYLALWLILPADRGSEDLPSGSLAAGSEEARPAEVVLLARVAGVCLLLAAFALTSGVATLFGLGWVALVLAGLGLAAVVLGPARRTVSAGLLVIVATAVPSLAASAASISLSPETGTVTAVPATAAAVSAHTFTSGLGTMFIDLRHTALPSSGQIHLHIRSGIRRTIVALPHDRCVHVAIDYRVRSFDARLATLLSGRSVAPSAGLVLFNRIEGPLHDSIHAAPTGGGRRGPTLDIDASSEGGSLQVRDYPDSIDPQVHPDWPGLAVPLDARPVREPGITRRGYRNEVRYWRHRVHQERIWARQLKKLLPGPCGS